MAFLEMSMKFYPNTSYLYWVITSSGTHDTKSPHPPLTVSDVPIATERTKFPRLCLCLCLLRKHEKQLQRAQRCPSTQGLQWRLRGSEVAWI